MTRDVSPIVGDESGPSRCRGSVIARYLYIIHTYHMTKFLSSAFMPSTRPPLPQADDLTFRRFVHAAVLRAGVVVRVRNLGYVDVALRVGRDTVRSGELVDAHARLWVAQSLDQLAVSGQDRHASAEVGNAALHCWLDHVADVDLVIVAFALGYRHRVVNVPLIDVLAVECKDLDAEVFAVGDDDFVFPEHRNVVGKAELTVVGAGFAPREHVFAVGVETMNSGVAVAVGDEEFPGFGVDGDVGRSVEVASALPFAWLALNSDRDLFNALLVELSDVVSVVVDHVDVVIAVDLNAVGTGDGVVQHRAN